MGDVVSAHLDESRREMITARTGGVIRDFSDVYEQQYAVALFNSVRYEIEGGGGPQSQLLHRKDPLAGRSIFSGSLFQYQEESRKWRNRFVSVPDSYIIGLYESKTSHDRGLHPKVSINCAGYKALTSMEEYMELINTSLPDIKAKVASNPFIKCASQFPLILWHPYARHHYFCVMTEKEQTKWHAVLQDCVRHNTPSLTSACQCLEENQNRERPFLGTSDSFHSARRDLQWAQSEHYGSIFKAGLSEDCSVQTPAFTDSVRLFRQAKGNYGTWDMMCGKPPQQDDNILMISDAVYKQVLTQTSFQYDALVDSCEAQRVPLDARLRTDMDQMITSKEHVSGKIRALVLPKAEQTLRTNVQPYISSILEALMEPTSRGFSEVRDVFFREMVEISKKSLNGGGKDKLGDNMERLSMLAFHPVKMQSCYEKVEQLNLEGLQQRFDVASPSVFVSRAQILMREQMDNAVYTFEQLLHQSLETKGEEDMCKTMQRCQDRVLKKYDYDSSTVRKKFFREALLQIIIPYMLKQLSPSCLPELTRFKELIFEDFSRFLLVENMFEELVLQSVSKDIMMAVKEAAVQRRHNLYRDSMILTNSDPNLHLLGESSAVDWAAEFGADEPEGPAGGDGIKGGGSVSRRRQVVSMIQLDGLPLPFESCMEVPGVELIPEEDGEMFEGKEGKEEEDPKSPDSVNEIRGLINPVVALGLPVVETKSDITNGTEPTTGTVTLEDSVQMDVTHVTTVREDVPMKSPRDKTSPQTILRELVGSKKQEVDTAEAAIQNAIEEIEIAVQEDDSEKIAEVSTAESDNESSPAPQVVTDSSLQNDSGFQSQANEGQEEDEPQPITNGLNGEDKIIDTMDVEVILA
ncbi:Protein Niban 2 [Dissostichus eleginoides]|uniref:Protein Niban 2 n=1 Tax=Dissostichus eleginoides TaxID=100907 RepID=A0AAD9F030_DISEL|nr:Protein Niban 2 [Dissostichus eleginoides]